MKIYFKALLVLFLIFPCIKPLKTFPKNIELDVKTKSESIKTNEEFYIHLNSNKIDNLYSLSFDFKFNPNIIEILEVNGGDFFKDEPIEFKLSQSLLGDECKFLNFYTTFTGNHNGKSSQTETELIKIKAKLKKDCKIPFSIINNKNNLFIGTPNIRLVLVDNNLNILNIESPTKYIKSSNFTSDQDINIFINDVYRKTLSREPEEFGFKYWYNKLISHEYSIRNFLINILNEEEFINKNLSDSEFISSMYSIIGGREPDIEGFNYWLNTLKNYQTKMGVKESKSKIILMICNETELKDRTNKLNLKF